MTPLFRFMTFTERLFPVTVGQSIHRLFVETSYQQVNAVIGACSTRSHPLCYSSVSGGVARQGRDCSGVISSLSVLPVTSSSTTSVSAPK